MFVMRTIAVMQESKKAVEAAQQIRTSPHWNRNMAAVAVDGTRESGDCLPSCRRLPSRRTPPQLTCT